MKHERDGFTHALIWVLDHLPIWPQHIPYRQASEQLSPPGFGQQPLPHAALQYLELHHTERPLDTEHQLIIQQVDIVELLLVANKRAEELTDLQQLTPVFVVARQPRELATEDDPDFGQRHLTDQLFEPRPPPATGRRADAQVGVEDLHLRPPHRPRPISERILQPLTFKILTYLSPR